MLWPNLSYCVDNSVPNKILLLDPNTFFPFCPLLCWFLLTFSKNFLLSLIFFLRILSTCILNSFIFHYYIFEYILYNVFSYLCVQIRKPQSTYSICHIEQCYTNFQKPENLAGFANCWWKIKNTVKQYNGFRFFCLFLNFLNCCWSSASK